MSKRKKISALIIPGDSPPPIARIKRHLLFFDTLSLIDHRDKAVVNIGEITEKFPNMTIKWADYAPYPRSNDYNEEFDYILRDTQKLQRRGILRVLKPYAKNSDDAGVNFMLYNSAISDSGLVKRAIPDFLSTSKPKISIPDGMISGGGISQSGCRSKYELNVKAPCELEGIDDSWQTLGYLRTGRTLKAMRRSYLEGTFPIAFDETSQNIFSTIAERFLFTDNYVDSSSQEGIANSSISLDVIDPIELEIAVDNMSWEDVLLLRKEMLPSVASFRDYVLKKISAISNKTYSDSELIRKEIIQLKVDFDNKREDLANQWEKLRIASILKFGGVVGAGKIGLLLLPINTISFGNLLLNIVSVGLIGVATLKPEIQGLIIAKSNLKKHPLFFFDSFIKKEIR